jgi:hypothetical protein
VDSLFNSNRRPVGQSLAPETLVELGVFAMLVQDEVRQLRPTHAWCLVPD